MTLAEIQADFGRWLREECPAAATALGGGAGLDVYLNTYRSQLIAALESGFPQLLQWLGEGSFLAAAATHIDASPPRVWTLDAYGADFPETVAALYPEDPECAELAQIEWCLAATFTTPDVATLAASGLDEVDWDEARFDFVPSLALLPVATNAAALWQALSGGTVPPPAQTLAETRVVLLWRDGFHPSFRTIEPAEAAAMRRLQSGMRFGDLCAALGAEHGEGRGAEMVGAWLGGWLRDGLIAAIL